MSLSTREWGEQGVVRGIRVGADDPGLLVKLASEDISEGGHSGPDCCLCRFNPAAGSFRV